MRFSPALSLRRLLVFAALFALGAVAMAQVYEPVFVFKASGRLPWGQLLKTDDGSFYGVTESDGPTSQGTIFRITGDGVFTPVSSFSTVAARYPKAGLTRGADGEFYGITSSSTSEGGSSPMVYRLSSTGVVTVIYTFPATSGFEPRGELTLGNDGNLYGVMGWGGTNNFGTIFRVTPTGSGQVLHHFDVADGIRPRAGLVLGRDGNLYGTAAEGGASFGGTIFRLTSSGVFSVLRSLASGDGVAPAAGLTVGTDGSFYGTTTAGGAPGFGFGSAFRITAAGGFSLLHYFIKDEGYQPLAPLTLGSDGNFYGTASVGGANDRGSVFKMTPAGAVTVLHSFDGINEALPYGGVTEGDDGAFYGTTHWATGGETGYGAVYRVARDGTHTLLHRFGHLQGFSPEGVRVAADGSLYGVTVFGEYDQSTVFRLSPAGGLISQYHHRAGGSSRMPIEAADGNLYGLTNSGGANGMGTVYRLTPNGEHTLLASLTSSSRAGLTIGPDGNFYGVTENGGSSSGGTFFRVTPAGVRTTLFTWGFATGRFPLAELILGKDGNFYGTTAQGGANGVGTVFRMTPAGGHTLLHSFTEAAGREPGAPLVEGADGNFYGTTMSGGVNGVGTIFRITPIGVHTLLYSFNRSDGYYPQNKLVQRVDGYLYGGTEQGGTGGKGTLFRISPTGDFTLLHRFRGHDGSHPDGIMSLDASGTIWGATARGGAGETTSGVKEDGAGGGVIFKLSFPPPTVQDLAVADVTLTQAVLNAKVNPNGSATTAWLEYGTTSTYGTASIPEEFGDGNILLPLNATLTGLVPHTTYHVRVVATSREGRTEGPDTIFTTPNTLPIAAGDRFHLPLVGAPFNLEVTSNDADADMDSLTIVAVSDGAKGQVTTDGTTLTYAPAPGYDGNDQFTYTVSDGFGGTATAEVMLVNSAPLAADDIGTFSGAPVIIPVLENDTDSDAGDSLTITAAGPAVAGTVAIEGENLTYTPGPGFTGVDQFTYTLSDGFGGSAIATVRIVNAIPVTAPVATVGEEVPGEPAGTQFGSFGVPSINALGQVAFAAKFSGATREFAGIVGPTSEADIGVVARTSQPAPGAGGATFRRFKDPVLSDGAENGVGRIAFSAVLSGAPKDRDTGVWSNATLDGALALVVREGDEPPGIPTARFTAITSMVITPGEEVYFVARLARGTGGVTAANDVGLWRWSARDGLMAVLREGDLLEVAGESRQIKTLVALTTVPGSPGQGRAYDAQGVGCRLTFVGGMEAVLDTDGALIAHTGGIVPILSPEVRWRSFGIPTTRRGYTAFRAELASSNGGVARAQRMGVFVDGNLVERSGTAAPGAGSEAATVFFAGFDDPVAGEGSGVAFRATLAGSDVSRADKSSLWWTRTDAPALLARAGSIAPGTGGALNDRFLSLALPDGSRGPLFTAKLRTGNGGVTRTNNVGLWAVSSVGQLELLARTGTQVGLPGVTRTVRSLTALVAVPGSTAQARAYNDSGQVVYRVTLSDRSQAILQTRVP